jgi:hypothetical protein
MTTSAQRATGGAVVFYHRPVHLRFRDAATVREHIHAFRRHSSLPVFEINTELDLPSGLWDVEPGVVLLHYSLFGSGYYQVPPDLQTWLRRTSAVKAAFFQDEFYFSRKRFGFVNDFGIDLVYTHVSPRYFGEVWNRYAPRTRPVFNLPGYVDGGMLEAARRFARPDAERDIDVSYRGRPLPPHMGAGSQEKRVIGERFRALAAGTALRVDIETSEEKRLYGKQWYEFLGRSKATLGVESGVSFMDLEDECLDEYLRLRAQGLDPTLEQLEAGALGRWDGNIPYRTIGPRHFEAAAFRICQVLFEGEYSGAMEPMVHYLPLANDFSNFDEVANWLQDADLRRRITDRAYDDLIGSGRYSYESFVRKVEEDLFAAGVPREVPAAIARHEHATLGRGAAGRELRAFAAACMTSLRYVVWRIVAPISLKVRRTLGLPLPPG